MLFFSASTNGFYSDDLNTVIPADAKEITAEQHTALLAAQSQGHVITADANGDPISVVPAHVPMPNLAGFISDIKVVLGGPLPLNDLVQQYPIFYDALKMGEWDDAAVLAANALSKGFITAAQYAEFQTAFNANNIPVTLP